MVANADQSAVNVAIADEDDIVLSRQQARMLAASLGFGPVDQSRIATAVSELARNVIRYAIDGKGQMVGRRVERGGQVGIEIVVSDDGPGIADLEEAMSDGYTSGHGMGLGLPGTKRLMDEMQIDTALGRGTVVLIRKWKR